MNVCVLNKITNTIMVSLPKLYNFTNTCHIFLLTTSCKLIKHFNKNIKVHN